MKRCRYIIVISHEKLKSMFNLFKKKEKSKPTFMELLDRTGYFEFTDKEKLQELKASIQSGYEKYRIFNTKYDNNSCPNCKKVYFCDSEKVFEEYGYKEQLKKMKGGIEKVANFNDLINHIPESFDYESNLKGDWFDGVADFTKRINDFLEKVDSKYKFYPAYGGNEGSMYILNEYQYLLLNRAIKYEHTRPMELGDWIDKYKPNKSKQTPNPEMSTDKLSEGMQIKHMKFGIGQILEINDKGVANINFEDGEKKIILKYAKLELLN